MTEIDPKAMARYNLQQDLYIANGITPEQFVKKAKENNINVFDGSNKTLDRDQLEKLDSKAFSTLGFLKTRGRLMKAGDIAREHAKELGIDEKDTSLFAVSLAQEMMKQEHTEVEKYNGGMKSFLERGKKTMEDTKKSLQEHHIDYTKEFNYKNFSAEDLKTGLEKSGLSRDAIFGVVKEAAKEEPAPTPTKVPTDKPSTESKDVPADKPAQKDAPANPTPENVTPTQPEARQDTNTQEKQKKGSEKNVTDTNNQSEVNNQDTTQRQETNEQVQSDGTGSKDVQEQKGTDTNNQSEVNNQDTTQRQETKDQPAPAPDTKDPNAKTTPAEKPATPDAPTGNPEPKEDKVPDGFVGPIMPKQEEPFVGPMLPETPKTDEPPKTDEAPKPEKGDEQSSGGINYRQSTDYNSHNNYVSDVDKNKGNITGGANEFIDGSKINSGGNGNNNGSSFNNVTGNTFNIDTGMGEVAEAQSRALDIIEQSKNDNIRLTEKNGKLTADNQKLEQHNKVNVVLSQFPGPIGSIAVAIHEFFSK